MEILAVVAAIVFGVFLLQVLFGALGLVFQIVLFPIKLVLGLVFFALMLPFLVLLLPVAILLGVGVLLLPLALGACFLACLV